VLEHLDISLRCLIGVVFLAACIGKVGSRASWREFVASVAAMRVVPARLVPAAAYAVGLAEAAVVVLLLLPPTGRLGHLLAVLLLVAFSGGIAVTLRRRTRVACRCFGAAGAPLGRRHLLRNGLLITAALVGVAVGGAGGGVAPAGVAVAGVAGVVLGLLFVRFDDIVELFVAPPARPGPGIRAGRRGGPEQAHRHDDATVPPR